MRVSSLPALQIFGANVPGILFFLNWLLPGLVGLFHFVVAGFARFVFVVTHQSLLSDPSICPTRACRASYSIRTSLNSLVVGRLAGFLAISSSQKCLVHCSST